MAERFVVESLGFEQLTESEQAGASCNGGGREFANYIRVTHNGVVQLIESDACEPEDARFSRDYSWIATAIRNAYEFGKADAVRFVGPHPYTEGPWEVEIKKLDHGGWKDDEQQITIHAGNKLIAQYTTGYSEYPSSEAENAANARVLGSALALAARVQYLERRVIDAEAALRVHDKRCTSIYWEEYPEDMTEELVKARQAAIGDEPKGPGKAEG